LHSSLHFKVPMSIKARQVHLLHPIF
jgi:hypothetical protein